MILTPVILIGAVAIVAAFWWRNRYGDPASDIPAPRSTEHALTFNEGGNKLSDSNLLNESFNKG